MVIPLSQSASTDTESVATTAHGGASPILPEEGYMGTSPARGSRNFVPHARTL
jgi:hypothetical protein